MGVTNSNKQINVSEIACDGILKVPSPLRQLPISPLIPRI